MDTGAGSSNPNPVETNFLYLQENHRSQDIWDTEVEEKLHCRRNDIFVNLYDRETDVRVQRYLHIAGFYGLFHVGYVRFDWPLLTALVERWRQETHTFHFPPGECTVTLQDMEVLAGLRVDGKPVIVNIAKRTPDQWRDMVHRLLGKRPDRDVLDKSGNRISISWLSGLLGKLPDDADDEVLRCRTRVIIMLILGGQYLSDKSGKYVRLIYLPLLENFEECGQYSWGSAILAYLYRELCKACEKKAKGITGPLVLLQIWAWSRFTQIRPKSFKLPAYPDRPPVPKGTPLLPVYPYAYRWRIASPDYAPVVKNSLKHYRDQFDMMQKKQIVWEPYGTVIGVLPEHCVAGKEVWRARVPLICFSIVEYHYPDRVLRQFGMRQCVPENCFKIDKVHKLDFRGNGNWPVKHQKFVDAWADRIRTVKTSESYCQRMAIDDPYMIWYREITRLRILPVVSVPARGFQPLAAVNAAMATALGVCYDFARELQIPQVQPLILYLTATFKEIGVKPSEIIRPNHQPHPRSYHSSATSTPTHSPNLTSDHHHNPQSNHASAISTPVHPNLSPEPHSIAETDWHDILNDDPGWQSFRGTRNSSLPVIEHQRKKRKYDVVVQQDDTASPFSNHEDSLPTSLTQPQLEDSPVLQTRPDQVQSVAGVFLSHKTAGMLSTIFDIGGVLCGILACLISDILKARGTTSVLFLLLSIPALIFCRIYGNIFMFTNIILMFSYNDTDGTGAVGAAIGPVLAGYISTRGWNSVFGMLIVSLFMSALLLVRVVRIKIKEKLSER